MEMSRYIVNISSVGPSRYDISKRKLIERKIEKYRPISPIYRYIEHNIGYKTTHGTNMLAGAYFYNFINISTNIDNISAKKSSISYGHKC